MSSQKWQSEDLIMWWGLVNRLFAKFKNFFINFWRNINNYVLLLVSHIKFYFIILFLTFLTSWFILVRVKLMLILIIIWEFCSVLIKVTNVACTTASAVRAYKTITIIVLCLDFKLPFLYLIKVIIIWTKFKGHKTDIFSKRKIQALK